MSEDSRVGECKPWFRPFDMKPDALKAILTWWKSLVQAKGDRAEMRRAAGVQAMVFVPSYHRLRVALETEARCDRDGLAVMAGCLAVLRQDLPRGKTLPEALAGKLSPLRFRRLLHVSNPDESLRLLRRNLALLDGVGGVRDVAAWSYALGVEALREDAVRRFAFAYYGTHVGSPTTIENLAKTAADNA